MVKNVPANYRIRCSGLATSLTACRVWYGVGAPFICQPDSLAGIKPWSPTAFPSAPPHPFSSLFILAMSRASGLWRALLSP